MAQVASLFTLFTHHAKTTDNLISYMRNALLKKGGFRDEAAALEQVVEAISFDIHMRKAADGHRYIERITEIGTYDLPDKVGEILPGKKFITRDIVIFQNGKYARCNPVSIRARRNIEEHLTIQEREEFRKVMNQW